MVGGGVYILGGGGWWCIYFGRWREVVDLLWVIVGDSGFILSGDGFILDSSGC